MSTMVISGSAKDQSAVRRWGDHWVRQGYSVVASPAPIPSGRLLEDYPGVFRAFYEQLAVCDALFVMNEDRDDVAGYVGAATFAELSFAVARNAFRRQPVDIVVLQPVSDTVSGADEIRLWHSLGWIRYHRSP